MMRPGNIASRFIHSGIDPRHPVRSALRWPGWLLACWLGRPVTAQFATGGMRMRLQPHLHSFGSTALYIRRDEYEPELLAVARLIPKGSVAIDIGGSFGVYTLAMAAAAGDKGLVHSFEPGRFSFSQIRDNVALNGLQRIVHLHHAAAADQPGTLKLYHLAASPVNFSMGGAPGVSFEEVPAVRVDDVIPREQWDRASFIKIDVEGFELPALQGAAGLIASARPVIQFELSVPALERLGRRPEELWDWLAGLGYRFWMLDGQRRFCPVESWREGNLFAAQCDLAGL